MKLTRLGGALALALMLCAPVMAQHATFSIAPAGWAPETATVTLPATSTPQEGSATASAVTPTSGTATFTSGVAYIGPITPVLGRDLRVILKGTWAGTVQIGTASAANGCTPGNINPLTVGGGQAWGKYTSNANEVVDTPTLGAVYAADGKTVVTAQPVYCAMATITSGTLSYAVRQ